jgi:hypothetical protein
MIPSLRRPVSRLLPALALLLLAARPGLAQEEPPADPVLPSATGVYFLGYETEPGMDYGGRTVASLQSGFCRAFGAPFQKTSVAPAWEFPIGAALLLVQHEVGGHGGRGREFGLSPSYGFGFDFSGYTTTDRAPATNEENILLAAGGTEADGVMARRILLEALEPEGVDGAKIPLALMAKLDLTIYVLGTSSPGGGDFAQQYRDGNDTAFWAVARQAQRVGADPTDVWNGVYAIDSGDPLLDDTWDDARLTALWNVLDPSLGSALYAYFRDHVRGGQARVHPPLLHRGGWGFTLGTRGALGPQEVTRFLDLHAVASWGVLTLYVRDLDSTIDRAWGLGAGVSGLRLGSAVRLGVQGDWWEEPDAAERIPREDGGWNVSAEIDALLGERWGVAAKVGSKSEGFFPGAALDEGVYAGFGVKAVF